MLFPSITKSRLPSPVYVPSATRTVLSVRSRIEAGLDRTEGVAGRSVTWAWAVRTIHVPSSLTERRGPNQYDRDEAKARAQHESPPNRSRPLYQHSPPQGRM